jgi:hypothetical protein
MDTVKLLNYMESLRYDRKMTQEVYLYDVISQRQYYRYRSGESEVPFDVIIKFANKLQIPLLKLISSYHDYAAKETEIVKEYFNLVVNKQLKEAKQHSKKISNLILIDDEAAFFFKLSQILYDFFTNNISSDQMITQLKSTCDFDNIMKKELIHDNEIYILGVIMEYSSEERSSILNKIQSLRKNKKLLLGGNVLLNSQVFFWILKNLGRKERYQELIEVANEAIDYSEKNYSYYSVEFFHYYKALAYFYLEDTENFEEALTKTIISIFNINPNRRKHFIEMIKKDTNIEYKSFFIERIKKEF